MAGTNSTDQQELQAELFHKLIDKSALQKISIYNDTVLHMASRLKEKNLVGDLLDLLPEDYKHQLAAKENNVGSSILHEVAASDTMKDEATKMVKRDPELLLAHNKLGETPFFFLAGEMKLDERSPEDGKQYLRRNDKTTVLHISVVIECFELVNIIAKSYSYLIEERDQDSMIWPKHPINEVLFSGQRKDEGKTSNRMHCEKLARILVEVDTSWDASGDDQNPVEKASELSQKKEGKISQRSTSTSEDNKRVENPLLLATISNIPKIVKAILDCQPQAIEHTNKEGMNILHVTILFKVKKACQVHVTKPLNKENKTAEELFATRNEKLHKDAKEWLMRSTENCTLLSVFIATVAFAAAYTVPGGPDQNTGIPILNCKPFFVVFILADLISLTLALRSVGIFLSILQSSFPLEDFEKHLFKKLIHGIICLTLSVLMMAVAFGATIILIMKHNWKKAVWHVVAFLPVPIFFLSYSPLFSAVLRTDPGKLFKKVLKSIEVVALVALIILLGVIIHIFIARMELFDTVAKACEFIICKPVRWICCQQTAAPGTEV
ncbi:hypothetical protein AAG906_009938 [Vitis piasezkii]